MSKASGVNQNSFHAVNLYLNLPHALLNVSFLLQNWRPLIDVDVWMTTPKTRCLGCAMVKLPNWTILHKFSLVLMMMMMMMKMILLEFNILSARTCPQ